MCTHWSTLRHSLQWKTCLSGISLAFVDEFRYLCCEIESLRVLIRVRKTFVLPCRKMLCTLASEKVASNYYTCCIDGLEV